MANNLTYTFRVAEQLFTITGSEQTLLAAPNLAPFRVSTEDYADADKRFVMSVRSTKDFGAILDFTHFFTDNAEADMPRIEVYQSAGEWLFRVAQIADAPVCCEIRMTKDFRQATLTVLDTVTLPTLRFAIDNATMLLFAFATAHERTLEMHAAVVVHEGKARLFLGHSGTGKSTHARQWLAQYHTAYLLNDDNPVLIIMRDGKSFLQINDYEGLRRLYGELLAEIQRITSEGDYPAAKAIVEKYAVKVNPELHKEVLERFAKLNIAPYKGFVNPVYKVERNADGDITDVALDFTEGYVEQHLRYSRDYSPLPSVN